jgi:hypothetical protein
MKSLLAVTVSVTVSVATLCAATSVHAASWSLTPYPDVPGSYFTELWSINNRGVVVGTTNSGAFIDDHGHRSSYAFPDPSALGNHLSGISDGGVLVGGDGHTAFVDDHGTLTQIAVPGATQTFVRGISANGRYLAGTWLQGTSIHGYVLDRTTSQMTFVAGRQGGAVAMTDVNDNGVAVGVAGNDDASVVVDLQAGTTTWFDAADGFSQLRLLTINDAGELAGRGVDASHQLTGVIGNLADGFMPFLPQTDGYAFVDSLSDAGQATGEVQFYNGGGFNFVATRVTAVPEPAPVLLFATGLLAAGVLARRRRDAGR